MSVGPFGEVSLFFPVDVVSQPSSERGKEHRKANLLYFFSSLVMEAFLGEARFEIHGVETGARLKSSSMILFPLSATRKLFTTPPRVFFR